MAVSCYISFFYFIFFVSSAFFGCWFVCYAIPASGMVPEHEHMKIHEHTNLFLDFFTNALTRYSTANAEKREFMIKGQTYECTALKQ